MLNLIYKIDRGKDEKPIFSKLWQKMPFQLNCMRFTMNSHRPMTLKLNANKWISTIRYNQSTIQWESETNQCLKSAYLNSQINSISFIKITLWQVVLILFRTIELLYEELKLILCEKSICNARTREICFFTTNSIAKSSNKTKLISFFYKITTSTNCSQFSRSFRIERQMIDKLLDVNDKKKMYAQLKHSVVIRIVCEWTCVCIALCYCYYFQSLTLNWVKAINWPCLNQVVSYF